MKIIVADLKLTGNLNKEECIDATTILGPSNKIVCFNKPLNTKFHAQTTEGDIYVKGEINTTLTFQCARCLDYFDQPFNGEFSQSYDPQSEIIDISEPIRETVLADVPMKALCQDQCKGLCPVCGKNQNKQKCRCKPKPFKEAVGPLKNFPFPT